jgi:peptide/nickel transport system substrate-binding protein
MRKLGLTIGAAVAVLALAASAGGARTAAQSAAPFAEAWAHVPRTPAGRQAKDVLVFGMEQDITGFNTSLTCCGAYWAAVTGNVPVIRGAYNIDNHLRHYADLVSAAQATKAGLTFTIRQNANWYWGGRKLPVTYQDFAYSWRAFVNPSNDVSTRAGYDQITGFTHKGAKQITFQWKKPYADWRDLFGIIFPSQALAGEDFNTIWANCVCGSDGKPVSDGPFYLSNYTKGQGLTLKPNPYWYGAKPGLKEVDFKVITDTNTEVQSMRGGEVDAINPTFGLNLLPLKSTSGITFSQVPGLFQEHIDIQFGSKGQPLLRAPWLRQALMLGIDRQAIINAVYGELAGNTKPLNSLVYYPADASYRPDFAKWNYAPAKAIARLKKHCTGGPSTPSQGNSAIWTCSGLRASFKFTWTASNATRTIQEAIIKAELKSIGIEIVDAPLPANVVFGPTGIPGSNYDLADFAWVTIPDPAGFVPTWECGGLSNYLNYCNRKASKLLEASNTELDPQKRAADFAQADVLMANDLPSIPLYARPNPLIYKSNILGMKNNPTLIGFTWNIEQWKWK